MYAKSVVNLDITDAHYMVTETRSRGEYFVLVVGSACEVMVTMRNIPGTVAVAICCCCLWRLGGPAWLSTDLTAGDSSCVCVCE